VGETAVPFNADLLKSIFFGILKGMDLVSSDPSLKEN
jgi:hypothetical protein